MKIAVVIVTYNSSRFIPACFESLEKMNRDGRDIDIIVVDNASSDNTLELLSRYPFVTVLEQKENTGFAKGNNIGMMHAAENGAEYVYLLNHDTEVASNFLIEAVRVAEGDENIGSVQSLMLLGSDRDKVNSAGNAIHFLGFGFCNGYRDHRKKYDSRSPYEITYGSGAATLYRVSVLKEVGMFDEVLFMYHEDLDLGLRIRLMGYKNMIAPQSIIWHAYEFSRSIKKFYFMERNRSIVFLKNLRWRTLFLLSPFLLVTELGLIAMGVYRGWWREKLRAYVYFFHGDAWRHIIRLRRDVQKTRKISDREIAKLLSSTIEYQEVTGMLTRYVANPLMKITWKMLRFFIV